MKKKHIFIILLVFLAFNLNYAQEQGNINVSSQNFHTNVPASSLYAFDYSDKSIKGSVYIQESFMPARLTTVDGTKIYNLKYNAYNDEIEIQNENQEPNALNKNIDNLLITFIADSKTYEAIDYLNDEGNASRGYFVHINDANNKYQLLIREAIKFVDRKPAKTGYDKSKPAEFKRLSDTYFVKNGNNPAVEFPKNKKDLSKIFPEKYDTISSFIKENRIKTSKEEDLVELFNYINTL